MEKRTKFSNDFKLKAVHLSEKFDNIKDLAISLGIDLASLYRWRKEYFKREGEGEVFPEVGKSKGIFDPELE